MNYNSSLFKPRPFIGALWVHTINNQQRENKMNNLSTCKFDRLKSQLTLLKDLGNTAGSIRLIAPSLPLVTKGLKQRIKIIMFHIAEETVSADKWEDAILDIEEEINEIRIQIWESGFNPAPDQGFSYSSEGLRDQNYKNER